MRIDVLTLFPEVFPAVLGSSILRIAQEKGLVQFGVVDIRQFAADRRRSVDDKPYGGGAGMVMMPETTFAAVESVEAEASDSGGERSLRRVLLTPQGVPFTQRLAQQLAGEEHLILICGHYEGFDERIRLGLKPLEISLGDYILTGGEIPAMVVIDAVVRLIPGVVGDARSLRQDSFTSGMLAPPQYTRPRVFRGMAVPEVLLSGDHARVDAWRKEQAQRRTAERRPDLLRPEKAGSSGPEGN